MYGDYETHLKLKQQQVEEFLQERSQLRQLRQTKQIKPANHRILLALGRWMAASGQRIQARYSEETYPVPITGRTVYDC